MNLDLYHTMSFKLIIDAKMFWDYYLADIDCAEFRRIPPRPIRFSRFLAYYSYICDLS